MSKKQFISNLSSVQADVRKLDAKKIFLDNKNILEYIEESTPTITHSKDTRETVYEDDLWGQWVETKDDGTIVVHDDWVTNPNDSNGSAWLSNAKAVQDNKAYSEITTNSSGKFTGVVEDSVVANIQTERIKNSYHIFGGDTMTQCPLVSFIGDLSSLVDGSYMFNNTLLESFYGDSSGSPVNLSSLTNGFYMFCDCTKLTSFNSDLRSLTNGDTMFKGCENLTSFNSDLRSLTNGDTMFDSTSLTSFSSDLSNLVNGDGMFISAALTSFNSDLSSLTNGDTMFRGTPLTSFSGDLSSLTDGSSMFYNCKLTPQSVMYIVESIRNITEEKTKYTNGEIPWVTQDIETHKYSELFGFMENGHYVYTYNNPNPYTTIIPSTDVGKLTLGIDVTNDSETIEQQLQTFAEGCLCDSWAELKQEFVDKGWTVTFQYGGTNTDITLSEDEKFRGVPVYARLIEVSDEDKDKAEYCTEDGTKFYNIDWGHDVTDYDSYQYFGSLLEACGYFGVIPKKYLEES